jgi:large subunit ribosomal protein L32e
MTLPRAAAPEKTLKLRKRIKKRKPKFVRQESWKYIRLKENWRRPRGLDNKVRKRIKGWPPRVSAGYRGPKATRAFHPSGLEDILVYTAQDLTQIDPKTQAARIAHNVGKRKRASILTEAREKKILILNIGRAREATKKEEEPTEEAETEESKQEEKVDEGNKRAEKK